MKIYIFILVMIGLLGILINPNKNEKRRKIYIIIIFGIFTIVGAMRGISVGVDTAQFCKAFDRISLKSVKMAVSTERYEIGFVMLCKILSLLYNQNQILIIITSLVIFPTVGLFIYKNSKDVIFSSILYLTLNTYAMHMNVMRQSISISIFILGYEIFFKKGKFIKYIITVVFASLFHQTALIMIGLILLKNRKYTTKTYIITNILAIISFIFAGKIWSIAVSIFSTYAGYAKTEYFETSYLAGTISAFIAWLILTAGIFFERKNMNKSEKYNFLAYIMSTLFIIDVLVIKINLFVRLATYLGIFTCIWLPSTLQDIKDKNERILIKYIVLICFILYGLVLSIYRPEWYGVIPYVIY